MARRNKHSLEEIRQMVLDAAETIIINEGYPALKARRIAMDIGYTVGSIYMVFDNMADLVIHIRANTVDNLIKQLQQVPCGDSEQYIVELAKAYLQFACRNYNRWSMIFVQDAEIPEWYQDKINRIYSQIEMQLTKLAPNCSAQQQKQAAKAVLNGIHGVCSMSLTGKQNANDISDVENSVVLLVESFIGGWMGLLCAK